jgi:Tfp pilus assembly protein PilN
MSYNRAEVNLLPPELQPGPAVRYAFLINFTLIAAAVAFIVLDSVMSITHLVYLRASIAEKQRQIEARAAVEQDYQSLMRLQQTIRGYGNMVGLAAARYADMPVVLDRLSRLLPEGVYIDQVTNERAPVGQVATNVSVKLLSARRDPLLLQRTLEALKQDAIMRNCYLRNAENKVVTLQEYLGQFNVNWSSAQPGVESSPSAEQYAFEILVRIDEPMSIAGVPISYDASRYFTEFKVNPVAVPEGAAGGAAEVKAGAKAVKEGTTASQGMAYVDVGKEEQ